MAPLVRLLILFLVLTIPMLVARLMPQIGHWHAGGAPPPAAAPHDTLRLKP